METYTNTNIGSRLCVYRKHLKLTQAEMAEYMGISRSQYIKYENNASLPTLKLIFKLVEKDPKVNECWLIGADSCMYKMAVEDKVSQLESRIVDLEKTISVQNKLIDQLER